MKSFIQSGTLFAVIMLLVPVTQADQIGGGGNFLIDGNVGTSALSGSTQGTGGKFESSADNSDASGEKAESGTFTVSAGSVNTHLKVCDKDENGDPKPPVIGSQIGDACNFDDDGDGHDDLVDNCPLAANANQANGDGDIFGDVCDRDLDGDTFVNDVAGDFSANEAPNKDNCPFIANPDQKNFMNLDDEGDVCDDDDDNDNLDDVVETNGVNATDPFDADSDDDGVDDGNEDLNANGTVDVDGDLLATETDPNNPDSDNDGLKDGEEDINNNGIVDVGESSPLDDDSDNDTVIDGGDNCPLTSNGGQENLDGDDDGDACDGDSDNDGVSSGLDENDFDNKICQDLDNDQCNDCSIGVDGFGPLEDFDVTNDGLDTDKDTSGDTLCNVGDPDDDNDGVNDFENDGITPLDNCPLTPNPGQEDTFGDDRGDACSDPDEGICFPIKSKTGSVVVICI